MKPQLFQTPPISCVDHNSRTVLPTGALKLEGGVLYQQANMIVHRESAGEPVGFRTGVWIPVPDALVAAIRNS